MMEFNMTDSLHIQITFGAFSFIRISAKNLVKDGHYEFFFSSFSPEFFLVWLEVIFFFISGPEGHK